MKKKLYVSPGQVEITRLNEKLNKLKELLVQTNQAGSSKEINRLLSEMEEVIKDEKKG